MANANAANTVKETATGTAIVDRIATSDVQKRYNLKSRTAIANRLQALGIEEERDGKKSCIPIESLEKLEALDKCLKRPGATLEECAAQVNSGELAVPNSRSPIPDPRSLTPDFPFIQLVREIASALRPQQDPVAPLISLSTAADNEWLLTSGQVKALIGVSPRGTTFTRGSFTFIRSGKIGRESGWRVEKSSHAFTVTSHN